MLICSRLYSSKKNEREVEHLKEKEVKVLRKMLDPKQNGNERRKRCNKEQCYKIKYLRCNEKKKNRILRPPGLSEARMFDNI